MSSYTVNAPTGLEHVNHVLYVAQEVLLFTGKKCGKRLRSLLASLRASHGGITLSA